MRPNRDWNEIINTLIVPEEEELGNTKDKILRLKETIADNERQL